MVYVKSDCYKLLQKNGFWVVWSAQTEERRILIRRHGHSVIVVSFENDCDGKVSAFLAKRQGPYLFTERYETIKRYIRDVEENMLLGTREQGGKQCFVDMWLALAVQAPIASSVLEYLRGQLN